MESKWILMSIVFLVALANGGGCNVFSEVSDKKSDAAILDDVTNLIDKGLWNDAVLKWFTLSAATQALRTSKVLLATAYAGRGGLDVINLITSINGNTGGSAKPLLLLLMQTFKGSTYSKFRDEVLAQNAMFAISSNPFLRTTDENIFMLFIEFAKLGTMLAYFADNNGDGNVDATFDNCVHSAIAAPGGIPDEEANEFVVGIATIIQSINATGSSIAGSTVSGISQACNNNFVVNAIGFCTQYDVSTVTPAMQSVARTIVGESLLKIGIQVPEGQHAGGPLAYEFCCAAGSCNPAGAPNPPAPGAACGNGGTGLCP